MSVLTCECSFIVTACTDSICRKECDLRFPGNKQLEPSTGTKNALEFYNYYTAPSRKAMYVAPPTGPGSRSKAAQHPGKVLDLELWVDWQWVCTISRSCVALY